MSVFSKKHPLAYEGHDVIRLHLLLCFYHGLDLSSFLCLSLGEKLYIYSIRNSLTESTLQCGELHMKNHICSPKRITMNILKYAKFSTVLGNMQSDKHVDK